MHVVAPERLVQAINRSQAYLVSRQHADGYWVGELEANTTLTSEYILFRHLIGQVDRDREAKIVAYLLSEQLPDGGWALYYGGPSDLSTTVEAYVAMRLAGVASDALPLQLARERIQALGGLSHARVFTKIFLALFGQFDWRGIPVIPPEIISLPQSFYFNIYEF
jgi:squalene-hopene/tetraprenyl-beta-curcumene cyclase